ncbi:GcrA family cell cycle regulator [Methylocapsa acidiphila]|uniref:GcrA family cell cycle regulator n=1 Tax=Methylocapsa acidiphila TaxID=133552 RepID=UPI000402D544|nr:GcrA family cell cycle regulator [Methylocapsa acidiphila]
MSWTDERIDLLQKLWLQGMSASRIASELANGLTRNAVIGKVYRLGLSGRTKVTAATSPSPRPQQQKSQPRPQNPRPAAPMVQGNTALALAPTPLPAQAPSPAPSRDVVVQMNEPVTIMELRESMCRWPMGDPTGLEFRYCGARKPPGEGPYCAHHARIAYVPQQDRRRERRVQKTA